MADRRDLVRRILEAQGRVHRLAGTAAEAWLGTGLTPQQARALILLDLGGPVTVGGMARGLRVSNASASELVERLVAGGMATREVDPADRRLVLVTATARGATLAHRLRSAGDDAWARVLAVLDLEELTVVAAGMEVLARATERVHGGKTGAADPLPRGGKT